MQRYALMQLIKCCATWRWAGLFCLLAACLSVRVEAQPSQTVYDESLQNGWQNWGWGSIIDFNSSAIVHSGSKSAAVTITNYWVTNTWGAIYLHHSAFNSSPYTDLTFWIHGGPSGGQQLQVAAQLNGTPGTS